MTPQDREALALLIAFTPTGEEWRSPEGRYTVIPTEPANDSRRHYWCYDNHHPLPEGEMHPVFCDPERVVDWMESPAG